MIYHRVTYKDCLSVATKDEATKLGYITPMDLLEALAKRWCDANGYTLWGYVGNWCWDATRT